MADNDDDGRTELLFTSGRHDAHGFHTLMSSTAITACVPPELLSQLLPSSPSS